LKTRFRHRSEMQNNVIGHLIAQYTGWRDRLHTIIWRTQMSYYSRWRFYHQYRMKIFVRLFLNGWIPKMPHFVIKFDGMDLFDDEKTLRKNR